MVEEPQERTPVDNQLIVEEDSGKLSRRQFLKLAGIAAFAAVTKALYNKLSSEPVLASEPPQPDMTVEVDDKEIPIFCFNNPVQSGAELMKLRARISEGVNLSEINLKERGLEILISKQAWEEWQDTTSSDHLMDGEPILNFWDRHLKELNKALANSGLTDIRTHISRVIIWDEVDEQGNQSNLVGNTSQLQYRNSADTFGSWGISVGYRPKEGGRLHENWDDALLHELGHHLLHILPHVENYFNPTLENFLLENEDQGGNPKLRIPEHLKDFELLAQRAGKPFGSCILLNAHPDSDNLRFAPMEKLIILRAIQESGQMLAQGKREDFCRFYLVAHNYIQEAIYHGHDISPSYTFCLPRGIFGPGEIKARIYQSRIYDSPSNDNIHWQVEDNPLQEFTIGAGSNEVSLERELVKGGVIYEATGQPVEIANLFMLEVESNSGVKKVYAFTTWHLLYWHWQKQYNDAFTVGKEPLLGADGDQQAVTINLT